MRERNRVWNCEFMLRYWRDLRGVVEVQSCGV